MSSFKLRILSAERPFFEGECESLTVQLSDGEFGILAGHQKMVAALVPGVIRFKKPGAEEEVAAAGGGMIRIADGEVLILVDSAEHPEEIDEKRAQRALEEAKEALLQKQSLTEHRIVQADLARAASRLRASRYNYGK